MRKSVSGLPISLRRYVSDSSNPTSAAMAKKKLALLQQQRQQRQQQDEEHDNEHRISNESSRAMLAKKGFESVKKVPTTTEISPKDLLLDKFFQGYRPLTIPLSPNKSFDSPGTVVYFELDGSDDLLENGLQELASGTGKVSPDNIYKDKNMTRFQYSKHSFEDTERKLKKHMTQPQFSGKYGDNNKTLSSILNGSYRMSNRPKGRRRLLVVSHGKGRKK